MIHIITMYIPKQIFLKLHPFNNVNHSLIIFNPI